MSHYNAARNLVSHRRLHERNLQSSGYLMGKFDIGYSEKGSSRNSFLSYWFSDNRFSDVINTAAMLTASENELALNSFENNARCLRRFETELSSRPKYRPINGYGNNLKHPYWGTPGTPFGRFGPKSYDDGVHSISKSVSGSDLPSPRRIVQEVLLKAEKRSGGLDYNMMVNTGVLYITHDVAHQVPVEAFDSGEEIRCCSSLNKKVLSPSLSHSACLPISIGKDDPFYKNYEVRCLNLIRSETASLPSSIQYGEIMNKATAYMDHSIIYGNEEAETRKVRLFSGGKLNMGTKNILPVDSQGKYTKSSDRLTLVPLGAIWPVMFARNHNNLAEDLKAVNPHWDDEKLFQEARRINIAQFQKLIVGSNILEFIFKKKINESYSENVNPSTTLEFSTAAYRFVHYYLRPNMLLIDKEGRQTNYPLSDTLGRIDIVENNYDDAFRGVLNQRPNSYQYTDEVGFERSTDICSQIYNY
jgi:peroxidase